MSVRGETEGQQVTPLELFFDLVFVFGITQVTGFLGANPTWDGLLRGLLLLGALWWAWAAYAWLTNTLNPEEGGVRLAMIPALGLCGGLALYFAAHVGLRLRIGGGLGHGRPIATILLLGLLPVAREVPSLMALGLAAAVCIALIAYEALRYPYARAWIRSRHGVFTQEEAERVASTHGRNPPPPVDAE